MFAPISAIFSLLFFASTLANGIRLGELPSEGDSLEIVAGYTSGRLTGFASTPAAKALLLDAYAAGSSIEFIAEQDRTALRFSAPKWALPMLADRLPALFAEVPKGDGAAAPTPPDFRDKVEEEIRSALLGPAIDKLDYATGDAFVLISAPMPNSLRDALSSIPKRGSTTGPQETIDRLVAERTLRFKSDQAEGAVIFASPILGVYYRQWYQVLLLDRLIQRIVPLKLKTTFPLTVRPHYYRLELPVPSGQFPEPAEENLLQELQRLQFANASAKDLMAAKQDAVAYLESKSIREWFASHDLLSRREEGLQWIQSMSADDMRVTARDLLIMNRVVASWAPRPRQTSVTTESLRTTETTERKGNEGAAPTSPGAGEGKAASFMTAFPAHTHPTATNSLPERLSSGVSVMAGSTNAVFVSGVGMSRSDRGLMAEDLKRFQQYRPDRILVVTPATSINDARGLWSTFKGSATGESGVSRGKVSGGDLSALFVLKTILDLKIIESGWWRDASLHIDAGEGSSLLIRASDEKRAQILAWIKAIATTPLPDAYFVWAREIAIHRFDSIRPDLQALIWERDSQSLVQDPETVSLQHVQDVARLYF